jgi:perosamine synthetase
MHSKTVRYIRNLYKSSGTIALHTPRFIGNEQKYMGNCIETAEVSAEGEYVPQFESMVCDYTGAAHAVALNSAESALRVALALTDSWTGSEVLTQPLAYAGTANTISSCGAVPIFIDVERKWMGMDPHRLKEFLAYNAEMRDDGFCYNRNTQRRITACVPVHTLGYPCRVDALKEICDEHNIALIEDASDAFGSLYRDTMAGRYGHVGIYAFEGHKSITCGDGGVLVTDDAELAAKARRVSDATRLSHPLDAPLEGGRLSCRMSNLNAAVGCAQMEHVHTLVQRQQDLSRRYREFYEAMEEWEDDLEFYTAKKKVCKPNCWLSALIFEETEERDAFVEATNAQNVQTRTLWPLVNELPQFTQCQATDVPNARWLQEHIAVLPGGVRV